MRPASDLARHPAELAPAVRPAHGRRHRSTTWCPARKSSAPRTRTSRSCSTRCSATTRTATRSIANGPAPGGRITNTNYAHATPQRRRCRSAHHLQPDRRPDRQQPGGGVANWRRADRHEPGPGRRLRHGRRPGGLLHPEHARRTTGLSAPFNSWFTFFGQFFDHGLDLVDKGGNGTVFMPLQPDDPLVTCDTGGT